MRRLIALAGLALLVTIPGCKRKQAGVETIETANDELSTAVSAGNAADAMQLVNGFYGIEQGAWRWTRAKFAITLLSPKDAAQKGATLEFKFTLPETTFSRTGPVTLSAVIDGNALPPEKFEKIGEHIFRRDIPAAAFRTDTVTVEFSLDKFVAAGVIEQRELGVIAQSAALLAR